MKCLQIPMSNWLACGIADPVPGLILWSFRSSLAPQTRHTFVLQRQATLLFLVALHIEQLARLHSKPESTVCMRLVCVGTTGFTN